MVKVEKLEKIKTFFFVVRHSENSHSAMFYMTYITDFH